MRSRSSLLLWISAVLAVVVVPATACRKFYGEPAPSAAPNTPPVDAGAEVGVVPEPVDAGAPSSAGAGDAAPKPSTDGVFRVNEPTRGTVPASAVKQRVAAAMPAITACYERALAHQPALRGNVLIQFVVGADGTVVHAAPRPVADPIEDQTVLACIVAEFVKMPFPKPNGDRAVVTYPLHFEPPPIDAGKTGN